MPSRGSAARTTSIAWCGVNPAARGPQRALEALAVARRQLRRPLGARGRRLRQPGERRVEVADHLVRDPHAAVGVHAIDVDRQQRDGADPRLVLDLHHVVAERHARGRRRAAARAAPGGGRARCSRARADDPRRSCPWPWWSSRTAAGGARSPPAAGRDRAGACRTSPARPRAGARRARRSRRALERRGRGAAPAGAPRAPPAPARSRRRAPRPRAGPRGRARAAR